MLKQDYGKLNYIILNIWGVAFKLKPWIIHIQILMKLSLTTHSSKSNSSVLAVELASDASLVADATLNAPLLFLTAAIWRSD